jgi:hypothetical protein
MHGQAASLLHVKFGEQHVFSEGQGLDGYPLDDFLKMIIAGFIEHWLVSLYSAFKI